MRQAGNSEPHPWPRLQEAAPAVCSGITGSEKSRCEEICFTSPHPGLPAFPGPPGPGAPCSWNAFRSVVTCWQWPAGFSAPLLHPAPRCELREGPGFLAAAAITSPSSSHRLDLGTCGCLNQAQGSLAYSGGLRDTRFTCGP